MAASCNNVEALSDDTVFFIPMNQNQRQTASNIHSLLLIYLLGEYRFENYILRIYLPTEIFVGQKSLIRDEIRIRSAYESLRKLASNTDL